MSQLSDECDEYRDILEALLDPETDFEKGRELRDLKKWANEALNRWRHYNEKGINNENTKG